MCPPPVSKFLFQLNTGRPPLQSLSPHHLLPPPSLSWAPNTERTRMIPYPLTVKVFIILKDTASRAAQERGCRFEELERWMALRLKAPTALQSDPGSISGTHRTVHKCL